MIESLSKPVNLFKTVYSYLNGSATGKTDINGMPVSISAELTNNCNLRCPHCSSGAGLMGRKRGFMDIELFKNVMKELNPYLYNVNLHFQGEPMLHPQFFSFIANCLKTHSVVSTNGHYLSEESSEQIAGSGLNRLIVSLDGMDQETYSAYRVGGSVNRVIDGLKNVTRAKKKHNSSLKIEIQFLVNRFNEHQIPVVREFARSIQASLSLKSMQIIDKENIASWLPSESRFRRYKIKKGDYAIKNS
jgi:MoaA/NifB/PqqE/SkfB family radical SAM enzyme